MAETIIITILLISVNLIVVMVAMYFSLGNSFPTFIAALTSFFRDQKDLVNPNADIIPSQQRISSDVLKDRAAQVKTFVPTAPQQTQSNISTNTPTSPHATQTIQAPPTNSRTDTGVYTLPQELVQRSAILDAENPVIQSAPRNMNLR